MHPLQRSVHLLKSANAFQTISYRPLARSFGMFSLCQCCSFYPYEDENEELGPDSENWRLHPYLSTSDSHLRPIFGRNDNEQSTVHGNNSV